MAQPGNARSRHRRRNMARLTGAGLLLALAATAGHAEETVATGSVERHWTSNALDSEFAIADWYTLLRGSLRRSWGDADANIALEAEFQATRHDVVTIEDDRAAAVSAALFRRLPGGVELRGSLTYRASSEGDELQIGPLALGTARRRGFGGSLQAARLGSAIPSSWSRRSFETAGATRSKAVSCRPPGSNRIATGCNFPPG